MSWNWKRWELEKHCKILSTLCYERMAFSKGWKEVTNLNNFDLIFHLVEELIAERKNSYYNRKKNNRCKITTMLRLESSKYIVGRVDFAVYSIFKYKKVCTFAFTHTTNWTITTQCSFIL